MKRPGKIGSGQRRGESMYREGESVVNNFRHKINPRPLEALP